MAADRTDLIESIKADLQADIATLPVSNVIVSVDITEDLLRKVDAH